MGFGISFYTSYKADLEVMSTTDVYANTGIKQEGSTFTGGNICVWNSRHNYFQSGTE